MPHPVTGIDHCVILVRDLDAAYDKFSKLGFSLVPRGTHSAHMGTHNNCVALHQGYFEILAIHTPTPANEHWRMALEVREGLQNIVLATNDAKEAHAVFTANGIASPEPIEFARLQALPDGSKAEARFTVTLIPDHATSGIPMFVCQHHTPEVVWHKSNLTHANGVQKLISATAVTENPLALAKPYEKIFGADRIRMIDGALVVDTCSTSIRTVTPEILRAEFPNVEFTASASAPNIVALKISVTNKTKTAGFFDTNKIPYFQSPTGTIYTPPSEAFGALIEFA